MKIGAIIQARTGSTRLPNKVLMDLPYNSGITVLSQDIRRIKSSKYLDDIIIATTTNDEDDRIVEVAASENVKCFRGSEKDVLKRYYDAAKQNNIDVIVRFTSDCPCMDGEIIDKVILEYLDDPSYDFVATVLERTFPIGLDVEVIKFSALEKAYKNAKEDYQREHVSDYIYENPDIFKLRNVKAGKEYNEPLFRITLDTNEDYMMLCAIYDFLYENNIYFSAKEVVDLIRKKPWIQFINNRSLQKKDSMTLQEELSEAEKLLEIQGLKRAKEILLKNGRLGV